MKVQGGTPIITGLWEQESHWAQLGEIDIAEEIDQIDLSYITNQGNKNKITKLVAEYKINKSREIGMKLNIVSWDDIPVYQRARRLSQSEQKKVNTQIKSCLGQSIQPSCSDYASPIVLVKKKDNTARICIDYRRLNEKIIKARYPLPVIET